MLDMLSAIARKDYVDRRRRQAQGIEGAKAKGVYKGRPENAKRNVSIMAMLARGDSWNSILDATGASRSTLSRLTKRLQRQRETANSEATRPV
jgi:DNA invertase Pin-like site-specific DNA recombinase